MLFFSQPLVDRGESDTAASVDEAIESPFRILNALHISSSASHSVYAALEGPLHAAATATTATATTATTIVGWFDLSATGY